MKKGRIAIFVVAGIDVVVLVVFVVLSVMKAMKTATVDINVVPSVAKVVINGQEYGNGAYKVYPGKVMAEISADGFVRKSVEVNLEADDVTRIIEYLMPNEDNISYYLDNVDDAEVLAKIGGDDAQKMLGMMAIKDVLPIVQFEYGGLNGTSREIAINMLQECNKIICLIVTGDNSENHSETRNIIKEKGFNPDDYEITYVTR